MTYPLNVFTKIVNAKEHIQLLKSIKDNVNLNQKR